jgi:hypothetical protein
MLSLVLFVLGGKAQVQKFVPMPVIYVTPILMSVITIPTIGPFLCLRAISIQIRPFYFSSAKFVGYAAVNLCNIQS